MRFYTKKSRIFVITAAVLSSIIVLNIFQSEVRNFFYILGAPIQKPLWQLGNSLASFGQTFYEVDKVRKENEELKQRNQELLAELISLKELKRENEVLREALGVGLEKQFQLVFANIVGKDISRDYLLIDKGSADGVSKDMPVISQQKGLIGKISEVYQRFSRVVLISDRSSAFDAEISEKNIFGAVKGKGGLKIFLDLIPSDEEIKEGDILVTSRLSSQYPPKLLIGNIQKIRKSDIEPFQQANILPFVDARNINNIFIIADFK